MAEISEAQILRQIKSRLIRSEVQVTAPFPMKGLLMDAALTTPANTLILIDARISTDKDVLTTASSNLERFKEVIGTEHGFVAVPIGAPTYDLPNVEPLDRVVAYAKMLDKGEREDNVPRRKARDLDAVVQAEPEKPKTLFVAMPFAQEYEDTFFLAISAAAQQHGLVAQRMDAIVYDDLIMTKMHKSITSSALFIADLSQGNPNVMYELGYAKAKNRPTILISATPVAELPFDVRGWPVTQYKLGQVHKLAAELSKQIKELKAKE
ncbi:MAG: hypothetical protein IPK19_41625 [Chloroflexi bacterium]|nr:hypothetical protein [Chloroflexota bacterium]